MGLGLVVRNHNGDFLAAVRQGLNGITNPEMTETIAFRRAIQFALQIPYNQVVVASDCLSLINKLKGRHMDHSHTGTIVEDIKHLSRCTYLLVIVKVSSSQRQAYKGLPLISATPFLWEMSE